MARQQASTRSSRRASAPDLCPECEADSEVERIPNGFQVVCTDCHISGPTEPTRAAAVRYWGRLAAKVRAFDRVREVVAGARA